MDFESTNSIDRMMMLIACQDVHGFYRFPGSYENLSGFFIERSPVFMEQLEKVLLDYLGESGLAQKVNIQQTITPMLTLSSNRSALLLFARLERKDFIAPESWPTMPDILKKMPKNKNRIAYLKVMQVLSGAWDQEIDAIELNERTVSELFGELWKN